MMEDPWEDPAQASVDTEEAHPSLPPLEFQAGRTTVRLLPRADHHTLGDQIHDLLAALALAGAACPDMRSLERCEGHITFSCANAQRSDQACSHEVPHPGMRIACASPNSPEVVCTLVEEAAAAFARSPETLRQAGIQVVLRYD